MKNIVENPHLIFPETIATEEERMKLLKQLRAEVRDLLMATHAPIFRQCPKYLHPFVLMFYHHELETKFNQKLEELGISRRSPESL